MALKALTLTNLHWMGGSDVTLVVGRAAPDIGFLVADTLLSFPFELKGHLGPVNQRFHTL